MIRIKLQTIIFFLLFSFPAAAASISPCFTPPPGCAQVIIQEINQAKSEILVQAYSFTSAPIAKALVDAKKRRVNIIVILDKSNKTAKYSSADFLVHAGITTLIDSVHAIAHSKIMIIDKAVLITGSFNFTRAADEKNAENVLIVKDDKPLIDKYLKNFEGHRGHGVGYIPAVDKNE